MEPNNRFEQNKTSFMPPKPASSNSYEQAVPSQDTQISPAPKRARKFSLLVTIVAVIVAAGLIALAVMAYLGKINPTDKTPSSNTSTQQSTNPSDVEATATDLENAVKDLDSTQDFDSEELSDSNLEL